jgi:hypothetical protein
MSAIPPKVTANDIFQVRWRPGRRVQEIAPPHRKGVIIAVQGTGGNASITVALFGHGAHNFRPGQLL